MSSDPILDQLKAQIAADQQPQAPLLPAWKRALFLFPVWLGGVAAVLAILGPRADLESLGLWGSWGLTLLQLTLAYGLIWAGLQQVIPGARTSSGLAVLLSLAGVATHLLIALTSYSLSPVFPPAGRAGALMAICFLAILGLAVLPLASSYALARRGLALSSVQVGWLCGLGAGLAGEAGWRMHCAITSWDHVLSSHSSAVMGAMLAGILFGAFWDRRRQPLPPRH